MTLLTATAARPRLGSGEDLQSKRKFKLSGSGGGGDRAAGTRVTRQPAIAAKLADPLKIRAAGSVWQSGRRCSEAAGPARQEAPGTPG